MLIEKSRSGVYQDTSENRRLHRVGQRYGEAKKPEQGTNFDKITPNSSRREFKKYLSGKNGGDYYRAVAEAYDAYKRGGGKDPLSIMLADVGSNTSSKDVPAGKYVEAVAAGASHDEAVKFADDSYKELRAKIEEIRKKDNGGGYTSTEIAKMWGGLRDWFKAQKFEKKAVLGLGAKKDEAKQEDALPKVSLSEKDFRREVSEEAMEEYPNAKVKLHHYLAPRTDYYDNDGNLMRSTPSITEFYSDYSQSSIGGYEIYFDKADSIGTFRTKESAIAALNKYVNAMRVKGHSKPEWTHNQSNGRYQWNYTVPKPPEKQVEETSSKVEKQPVKENDEKQDKPTSRVTFADVPHSKEVNLKKYLTDSRRKDVDRLMQTVDGMSSSAIKQAHDAAVKKFNDNFDSMKKSERASALYVIMKYKALLDKAK